MAQRCPDTIGGDIMRLTDDAIGITDLIAHKECPRRMSYGMRRHAPGGGQSDRQTPEAGSPATAYGSAIHDCIAAVEAGESDRSAIVEAYERWNRWLEPGDADRLLADLDIYRARDFPGTRTVAVEDELRVPLFTYKGTLIYFRFRLDRLYELLNVPGEFIHIDYKSSAHPRSAAEVDADLQMWAYNWAIHEYFPECRSLSQFYDQLRFGQIPTRKNDTQRRQIKDWLIMQTILVIEDDSEQPDGLLDYSFNQWCPWCPVMESCGVVGELTDFALTRIAALAPAEKQGRATVLQLDWARAGEYADELPRVRAARAVLKRFDESVAGMVKEMPSERRERLGYETRERGATVFSPDAVRQIHDSVGDDAFYRSVKLTKTALASELADDEATLGWALSLGQNVAGPTILVPRKDAA